MPPRPPRSPHAHPRKAAAASRTRTASAAPQSESGMHPPPCACALRNAPLPRRRACGCRKEGEECGPGCDCGGAYTQPAPLCPGHQLPCTLKTVGEGKENTGRRFFACPKARAEQCDFFRWAQGQGAPNGGCCARAKEQMPDVLDLTGDDEAGTSLMPVSALIAKRFLRELPPLPPPPAPAGTASSASSSSSPTANLRRRRASSRPRGRAASRARTAHGRVRRRHGWPSALHREPTQLQSRRCRASGNSCRPVETGRSCAFSKRKT